MQALFFKVQILNNLYKNDAKKGELEIDILHQFFGLKFWTEGHLYCWYCYSKQFLELKQKKKTHSFIHTSNKECVS